MFRNYIKVAIRNLRKHKAYSLINIAGLTVGMACFILIALWVYDETHYDSFHANSGRLFRLILHKFDEPADPGFPSTPYILPQILKSEGLFGLASLLTEQRKKEVGIRKVLGASATGILALLSRRFVLTVLAANLVAVPISYFVTRMFLNLFVYRTAYNPLVTLAASAVTFAVALATVSFQVLKTARINPADCLPYE